MNSIIKVSPSGDISTLPLPSPEEYDRFFCTELKCDTVTALYPKRLYSDWHNKAWPEDEDDTKSVCMLTDDNARWGSHPKCNLLASWLFETEIHQVPVMGPVLFVGQKLENGKRVFCGIDDYVGLALLSNAITATSAMKQVIKKRRGKK